MATGAPDLNLLAHYIDAFGVLDDLNDYDVPEALRVGTDEWGSFRWLPIRFDASDAVLRGFYAALSLPGVGSTRFPHLYESLIRAYRWAEVYLGTYRLLASEPAEDLSPLARQMLADKNMQPTLAVNGYIQFARADDSYDPVCFDFRHRRRNGDCRIVRIDHEEILCNCRVREVGELAPSFRSLVRTTIERAASRGA
jgi:hypothetical protein